jgi:hypothetical protein
MLNWAGTSAKECTSVLSMLEQQQRNEFVRHIASKYRNRKANNPSISYVLEPSAT